MFPAKFESEIHSALAMQEANLDHAFITRFCEFLLFRGTPRQDASEWTAQKQILLKYVQVSCSYVSRQQAAIEERIAQVCLQSFPILWTCYLNFVMLRAAHAELSSSSFYCRED